MINMKQAFYADYIWYDSVLHKNSWLLTNNGIIEGIISDDSTALSSYEKKCFTNSAIFPGLINTHAHMAMSIFRGLADDLPLMTWLNDHIWPAEKRYVSPEFVYNYTMLSIAESIRSGVTCVNDMYFHGDYVAKAFRDSSIRGVVAFGIMNSPKNALLMAENFEQDDFIKASLAPHALYTVGPEAIAKCVDFASKKNLLLHTHLAETVDETEQILAKYNKTPATLMNEIGAFDYKGSSFAHCVHLTDEEISIMGNKNVNISHCLESNLKLASGFAPIKKLIDAGANVSIGTDGAASNNDQSIIGEMSTVSKFHKAFNCDAQALPAVQVLEMATSNAAKALCFDKIGVLKQGNYADFFVLSFDAIHMTPVYNPISQLVYTANNNDVTDVYVNGRPIMQDRNILTIDEEKIKNTAKIMAKKIKG